MPHRNERRSKKSAEIRKSFGLSALPCFLLVFLSSFPALGADERSHDINVPEEISCFDNEDYRGQRGLSRIFFGESLPLPRLARSRSMNSGIDFVKTPRRYRTWVRGFGHWSNLAATGNSMELEYHSFGFSLGVDQQIGHGFLFGAALGSNRTSIQGNRTRRNGRQDADVSALHASIYARTTLDRVYFDIESGFGYNDRPYSSGNDPQWNLNGEIGTWWGHGLGKVEPFIGLRHVSLDAESGTETKTTLLGGLRYSWKTSGTFAVTTPRLYGGVLQELGDRNLMNTALFVDAPTVFAVPGCQVARTRLFLGGGFTSALGRSLDLYVRYTAEVSSDHSSHTAMLGMNWNF